MKFPIPRTQFDPTLLRGSEADFPVLNANHGRSVMVQSDGETLTALARAGEKPAVRIWRGNDLAREHSLTGRPSAPCFLENGAWWVSADDRPLRGERWDMPPVAVTGLTGTVQDVLIFKARTVILLQAEDRLQLAIEAHPELLTLDENCGRATMDVDSGGRLHVVYEKRMGLEYRVLETPKGQVLPQVIHAERVAEAYGFHPVVLTADGRIVIAYLGESCRLPSPERWGDAWERLGHGGYVAALVREKDAWQRFRLADSRQIAKPLRPTDTAFGGGPEVGLRIRIEQFGPPALTLGPDGVLQVFWMNNERRWVYGSRLLGGDFSDAVEVRGPFEQPAGLCLVPRRVGAGRAGIPVVAMTKSRAFLEEISLPARDLSQRTRIDFVQLDEVAVLTGLELATETLTRSAHNPVLPAGPPGSADSGSVLADISREGTNWKASVYYQDDSWRDPAIKANYFQWDGRAESADGIRWTKLEPLPLAARVVTGEAANQYNIRFLEDADESNPAHRFKGFWRSPFGGKWPWLAVTSPDGKIWNKVEAIDADTPDHLARQWVINADDDLRVWTNPHDIPERRFKASAISRSYCGRVACQWSSADGMHWNDIRDTLDFADPYGTHPDGGTTGRILLDSWAGPEDEDELHGGFVFRDGDRWLLHYMKWTQDGHIYTGLASSRDGINFARVGGGTTFLPLGEPGTWDAGRVAIREAPFRVGDTWRQYYVGCGWKHGMAGLGAKTSHWAGPHSPMQMGMAEMQIGHWTCLRLRREADQGEMQTIPLQNVGPMTVDVEGLERPGSSLRCQILDCETGNPSAGFSFTDCDPLTCNGPRVPLSWRGKSHPISALSPVRICLELRGHGVRVYGLGI